MTEEGIRALKQNASKVVARVAAGEIVKITDRGRPVALLTPIPVGRLDALVAAGRARPAKGRLGDLPAPPGPEGRHSLSQTLTEMRDDERY
ncbi:type II toxin-antitoxin system Phd/YefM family antitoxin [soil metagenome]|jgi:prevent-host-death family protein